MLPLYRNIKKRRTELDISQQELAELVGYKSKSMISQVENGTVDLSLTMIAKFASALKCTPSYLMGWEDITDANGVDVMARFGDRLKELRKAQNISQDELAKRLKVTRSCIGNYEQNNREPKYEDLETIADYFNVDMDYLIGNSTEKQKNTVLSDDERRLLEMYRNDSNFKEMINRLTLYATGLMKGVDDNA